MRREPADKRDLRLRIEAGVIHDDADTEPAPFLRPARGPSAASADDMERIVACVNACIGIPTEDLGIVSALNDAERRLVHDRIDRREDALAAWINGDMADDLVVGILERLAAKTKNGGPLAKIDAKLEELLRLILAMHPGKEGA